MKKYIDKEIEEFFIKTTAGFYLKKCAENGGEDAKGFYRNQLEVFTNGFKCCLEQIALNTEQ